MLAASACNGGAAWISNSSLCSVCHLAIVERLCVSRGVGRVFFRNLMGDGIAVLHECRAEHREVPLGVIVVATAGAQSFAQKAASGGCEERPRVHEMRTGGCV